MKATTLKTGKRKERSIPFVVCERIDYGHYQVRLRVTTPGTYILSLRDSGLLRLDIGSLYTDSVKPLKRPSGSKSSARKTSKN